MKIDETHNLHRRGEIWHLRVLFKGKQVRRSLKTTNEQRAKILRDTIIADMVRADFDRIDRVREARLGVNETPAAIHAEQASRIARHLWNRCRTRAKARKQEFGLTPTDILELLNANQWRCALSGLPLDVNTVALNSWAGPFRPSIDRISNRRGYVRDNVRIVCVMANIALNEWGEEALMKLVDAIHVTKHGQSVKEKD